MGRPGATTPPSKSAVPQADVVAVAVDAQEPAQLAPPPPPPKRWVTKYDSTVNKLPASLATKMPTGSATVRSVAVTQDKLAGFGEASKQQWGTAVSKTAQLRNSSKKQKDPAKVEWMKQAWSVTNDTQLPLNISLNQVSPLYFGVVAPGETFARRIPNVWHLLEVRPYTSPSSAYNAWSTTWPILCVVGPVLAASSLIALPIVAATVGGSALAGLTAAGASVSTAASSATTSATQGIAATATAVSAAASKADAIPGADEFKSKLADAGKDLVKKQIGKQEVQQRVVRYLARSSGADSGSGSRSPGPDAAEADGTREVAPPDEAAIALIKEQLGGDAVRTKGKKGKKIDEVDVTGHDIEKVLMCDTGDKETDKLLTKAFKGLSFKTKFGQFKTKDNPVLRIVGGPELEARPPSESPTPPPAAAAAADPAPRQVLVFHPFILVRCADLIAEPIPPSEVPPTEDEARLMNEAKVVESYAEAESAREKTEEGEDPERAVTEAEEEVGPEKEGLAPEDPIPQAAALELDDPDGEQPPEEEGEQQQSKGKMKNWFKRK